jgi:hypothetical protein
MQPERTRTPDEDRSPNGAPVGAGERIVSVADEQSAPLVVLRDRATLSPVRGWSEPEPAWNDVTPGVVDHRWEGQTGLIRVVEFAAAGPQQVYEALESLQHHLDWAGQRHDPRLQHVVHLNGPARLAAGDRFATKQHTKAGYWLDRSLVMVACRPTTLGFDTEGAHYAHDGTRSATGRWEHRYHLDPAGPGRTRIRYSCRWLLTKGKVEVYAAPIIAANVHRGVLNLVSLAQELAARLPGGGTQGLASAMDQIRSK